MNPRGTFLLFGFAAGLACAQATPTIEIHGTVTEVGSPLPLAGAEVTLYEFVRDADRFRTVFATAATDARGEFHFHPVRFGDYYLEAKKQSYVATMALDGQFSNSPLPEITGAGVHVSAEHPSQEVRLTLMRPGNITGNVIDENGKPLARVLVDMELAAIPTLFHMTAPTEADGSFKSKNLLPGEYLISIAGGNSLASLTYKFSEDDAKVVDQGLETVYWPGVPDKQSATPVRVSPGASASLGTIRLRTAPYYRVRVSIDGCQTGDRLNFTVRAPTGPDLIVLNGDVSRFSPASSLMSCEDFLLRGLKSGSYEFGLLSQQGTWASAPVEITNRNLEVRLTLSPMVEIAGRIVVAEGAALPALAKLRIIAADLPSFADAKGAFILRGLRGLTTRVRLVGLSNQYYVKEVRADGRTAPDGVIPVHSGVQVEIVIDDKPAAIVGTVMDGDMPVSQPLVYIAKWPTLELMENRTTGDNDGRFRVLGLAPGEYRVLAVPSSNLPDGSQIGPAMLSGLWKKAEKVTLETGGSQSVSVKLVDPMR